MVEVNAEDSHSGYCNGLENRNPFGDSWVRVPHPPPKTYLFMSKIIKYFARNLSVVIGLVLVWRGIWYVLDALDAQFLGGSHMFSAVAGIVAGLLVLYIPDHDLKELEKL